MSAVASLSEALNAADEALLGALRVGDVEAARAWAKTRESLIGRLASRVHEEPAAVRTAAESARAGMLALSRAAESERDRLSNELESVRLARSRLARAGDLRRVEPRFISRRT